MQYAALSLLISIVFLVGCATYPTAPPAISEAAPGPSVPQVRGNIEAFKGTRVRWGGEILSIKNQSRATWLEVLEYPLEDSGRPDSDEEARGRFFARMKEFLDPEIYERGREITVVGTIDESVTQRIGEHEYTYPVINVDAHHLWRPRNRYRAYPYGYGYPYYHPFFHHGFHRRHLLFPHHYYW